MLGTYKQENMTKSFLTKLDHHDHILIKLHTHKITHKKTHPYQTKLYTHRITNMHTQQSWNNPYQTLYIV